jgi:hypothetical protein
MTDFKPRNQSPEDWRRTCPSGMSKDDWEKTRQDIVRLQAEREAAERANPWWRQDRKLRREQSKKSGADIRQARSGRAGALADANDSEPLDARAVESLSTPSTLQLERFAVETSRAFASELPEYEPEVNLWAEANGEGWVARPQDKEKPEQPDLSKVQLHAMPEYGAAGYCSACHKALPRYGLKPTAQFCNSTCRDEFNNKKAKIRRANEQLFKDYIQPERTKAENATVVECHRLAAKSLSQYRGLTAKLTVAGIVVVHDGPLPPLRCFAYRHCEPGEKPGGIRRVDIPVVTTSGNWTTDHPDALALIGPTVGPERSVTLVNLEVPLEHRLDLDLLYDAYFEDPDELADDDPAPTPEEVAAELADYERKREWVERSFPKPMYADPGYGSKQDNSYLPLTRKTG